MKFINSERQYQPLKGNFLPTRHITIGFDAQLMSTNTIIDHYSRLHHLHKFDSDMNLLGSLSKAIQELGSEIVELDRTVGFEERGYFTSEEQDKIEDLLFRYLLLRDSLWDLIEHYRDYESLYPEENLRARAIVIGFSATLQLYNFSARVVSTICEKPLIIKKLNESYKRSEIPSGTYQQIFHNLTKPENLRRIEIAWQVYEEMIQDDSSHLAQLQKNEPQYRRLMKHIEIAYKQSRRLRDELLEKTALILPDYRNLLRHSEIARLTRSLRKRFTTRLSVMRDVIYTNVSSLKSPLAQLLDISADQIQEMKAMLQPGDIILIFTQGYMSNIFLPGVFKHGITYIGSPEQRKELGLGQLLIGKSDEINNRYLENLEVANTDEGHQADVIEAIAEGVIMSSLEKIMRTHCNRMVALRPKLSDEERVIFLTRVFSYLGNPYDFKFNFNEGTRQCCTEVIYRSLSKLGSINFPLQYHYRQPRLAADDIVVHALADENRFLDFNFLVVGNYDNGNSGTHILKGDQGYQKLHEMMQDV